MFNGQFLLSFFLGFLDLRLVTGLQVLALAAELGDLFAKRSVIGFGSREFPNGPRDREAAIVRHEGGVCLATALLLATLGEKIRALRGAGLGEGVSTRLLVYAGQLVARGLSPRRACTVAVTNSLTDDAEMIRSVGELVSALFPPA